MTTNEQNDQHEPANECHEYSCCGHDCNRPKRGRRWNLFTLLLILALGIATSGLLAMDKGGGESAEGSCPAVQGACSSATAAQDATCGMGKTCPVRAAAASTQSGSEECSVGKPCAAGEKEGCARAATCCARGMASSDVKQSCAAAEKQQNAATEQEQKSGE